MTDRLVGEDQEEVAKLLFCEYGILYAVLFIQQYTTHPPQGEHHDMTRGFRGEGPTIQDQLIRQPEEQILEQTPTEGSTSARL